MNYVLDAGAVLALIGGEQGGEQVQAILDDDTALVCAHVLNVVEIFYNVARGADRATAQSVVADLGAGGVQLVDTMDAALWEDAAMLKATWRRISLADCFGVALARRQGAQFVTTDRHELGVLDAAGGVARFLFIR